MIKKYIGGATVGSLLLFSQAASATIVLTFGTEFSGSGGSLSGPVIVTLDDGGGIGSVDVTIDATALDGALSEFISALYLNIDPAIDPAALGVATDGGAIDPIAVNLGTDAFMADGDGLYDILIEYANTAFTAGLTDTVTFSLAGLDEDDFAFLSTPAGGSGPFIAVLRARSLGADGEDSGWFFPEIDEVPPGEVPEPTSLLLLGLGLTLVGFRRVLARG